MAAAHKKEKIVEVVNVVSAPSGVLSGQQQPAIDKKHKIKKHQTEDNSVKVEESSKVEQPKRVRASKDPMESTAARRPINLQITEAL